MILLTSVVETAHPHLMDTGEFFVILTAAVTAAVMVVLVSYRGWQP